MTTPLTLNIDHRDGGTVALVATGEIDLSNVDTFAQAINDAVAGTGGGEAITVDLTAVEYLDSGAINVLFTYADQIRVVVKPLLIPVLKISGLAELTTVESVPPAAN
jgi:anti-anti-sigma factor